MRGFLKSAGCRLASAFVLLGLALLPPGPARADPSLQRVLSAGTLVVAVVENMPWAMRTADGQWQGHDIEIARQLASDLGVAVRFEATTVDEVPARLAAGADLAAGGLMVRSDMARDVVYSAPIALSVVRTVATSGLARRPSFTKSTRVAVLEGSVAEAVARHSYPLATLVPLPGSNEVVSAVLHGQADAMVASSPVPRLAASTFDAHLKLVGPPLGRTAEALAMRPDDIRLQAYVGNWIEARIADGWLRHVREKWFIDFGWMNSQLTRTERTSK